MDGSGGGQAGGRYVAPAVTDYGDLLQMTRDVTMLHVGFGSFASASSPGPGPGGGGGGDVAPRTAGDLSAGGGGDVSPAGDSGDVAGANDSGGAGDTGGGSTGSGSGSGSDGGGGGDLPFTGFPAAVAGALGAAMSAGGIAARKYLRRDA